MALIFPFELAVYRVLADEMRPLRRFQPRTCTSLPREDPPENKKLCITVSKQLPHHVAVVVDCQGPRWSPLTAS